jgi:phosphomannomutase
MNLNYLMVYEGPGFYPASLAGPLSCVIGAMHANYHTAAGSYLHEMEIVDGGKMVILAGVDPMGLAAINYVLKREDSKPSLLVVRDIDLARLDRAAVVDKSGNPINRNALIALLSAIILEEYPGSTIVTDSVTSEGLRIFIEEELKGKQHRFKRGYKNVIDEAIRLNEEGVECHLAIETSGHAALKENYFLDDGAFLVAKVLVKTALLKNDGTTIDSLIDSLQQPSMSEEYRLAINATDHVVAGNEILAILSGKVSDVDGWQIEKLNYEGIRVKCLREKGWFLLRLSLHDPLMVLNAESDLEGGVQEIISHFKEILSGEERVDISNL